MRTVTMKDVVRGAAAALVVAGVAIAQPVEHRVEFASPLDGATLVGTLTMPEGDGPFAAAVFVNATGAHPRDEARSGGRQWADLADALADAGVASLRLDARGVGESVSDGVASWEYRWTSAELAQDAAKAVDVVRGFAGIDGARVGMVCFSDGSAIGALAAESPAFVVLLSPSGVAAKAHILAEQKAQLAMTGAPAEDMARIVPVIESALATLADTEQPMAACREAVADVLRAMGAPEEQALMSADAALEELGQRGVRWYLGFDPAPAYAAIDAPALALVGAEDDRLQGAGNVAALEAAFGAERVVVLAGLGHFLQGDEAGVFAPGVVERIVGFVREQTN